MVAAPYLAAKAVSLLVPVLFIWQNSSTPGFPSHTELRAAFQQWDAPHYLDIAAGGYGPTLDFHYGFWYGYPLLIRVVSLVSRDDLISGLLISAVAELLALYYIARLFQQERDDEAARFSVWSVAMYPFAFFLSAVYTESCFIAAAAACLFYARRQNMLAACVAGAVASFIRIFGALLIPSIVIEYMMMRRRWRPGPELPLVLLVLVPIAAFSLYTRVRIGDWLGYFHGQEKLGNMMTPAFPWTGARVTWDSTVLSLNSASNTYVFGLVVLFGIGEGVVCLVALVSRRVPVSFAVYMTLLWLLIISRSYWLSLPRFGLYMFPALLLLSDALKRRRSWQTGLIATSGGFMALGSAIYASGHWLG
jgi:Gpi18-like mannosyltransferase